MLQVYKRYLYKQNSTLTTSKCGIVGESLLGPAIKVRSLVCGDEKHDALLGD